MTSITHNITQQVIQEDEETGPRGLRRALINANYEVGMRVRSLGDRLLMLGDRLMGDPIESSEDIWRDGYKAGMEDGRPRRATPEELKAALTQCGVDLTDENLATFGLTPEKVSA